MKTLLTLLVVLSLFLSGCVTATGTTQQQQQQQWLQQARAVTDAALAVVNVIQAAVQVEPPGPRRTKLLQDLMVAQVALSAAQAYEAALMQQIPPTTQP